MPFWEKRGGREIDPSRRWGAESSKKQPGLLDTLREDWDTMQSERQERKAALFLTPEKCPWCGKDMEQGFLSGSKGVWWYRGVPDAKNRWLGAGPEHTMQVDVEGGFLTSYKIAWHCPDCRKMTFDTADLQTQAEKAEPFPQDTEEYGTQPGKTGEEEA